MNSHQGSFALQGLMGVFVATTTTTATTTFLTFSKGGAVRHRRILSPPLSFASSLSMPEEKKADPFADFDFTRQKEVVR